MTRKEKGFVVKGEGVVQVRRWTHTTWWVTTTTSPWMLKLSCVGGLAYLFVSLEQGFLVVVVVVFFFLRLSLPGLQRGD